MLTRICIGLAILAATPVWGQLDSTPFEIPTTPTEEGRMLTPPPVSNSAYPTSVGSQMRSNYLSGGFIFNTAYNDNVVIPGGSTPIGEAIYSISPSIALDQTTTRQHLIFTYSPGFTFYQITSSLNAVNQTAALNFQYRLSEHTTVSVNESFQKSSNVFSQPYPLSGGLISSTAQSVTAGVVVPYAEQLSNSANASVTLQMTRNGMIGASGISTVNTYPHPAQAAGLYNSNSFGGSGFYSQRFTESQYAGVKYQYLISDGNPINSQVTSEGGQTQVQTHTFSAYYSIYFSPTLSLSLSGGPQYFKADQSTYPSIRSWTPAAGASFGWQRNHTNVVATYSRTVTAAVGLPGAFSSNGATASVQWLISHHWSTELGSTYFISKNVTPSFPRSNPGGHTVSGSVSLQYSFSDHLKAELGYARLHQSYNGIVGVSDVPNNNHEYISVSYLFTRPLGR